MGEIDSRQLELPLITVRESERAARATFHAAPSGVELVLPRRFNARLVPALLAEHRDWIERSVRRLRRHSSGAAATDKLALPGSIALHAKRERWLVAYRHCPSRKRVWRAGPRLLTVACDLRQLSRPLDMLRRWVRREADAHLKARTGELAERHGFNYVAVAVRNQKTLWGSCTGAGRVHLNYKLIFLPPDVVDHVILHELCHTRHLNHSDDFRRLLEGLSPRAVEMEAALKLAWRDLPAWIERN
jgi:hypothetical protein